MLYLLGALKIEVAPFNVHEVEQRGEADYAVKPIVGAEQPLEFVGEGLTEINLSGRLFPEALGGQSGLTVLDVMRSSGRPQFLMRGDGRPLGWFAILTVDTRSQYLNARGVGKMVEVSIRLRRAPTPAAINFFSLMQGIIQGLIFR
jgi:uncharacterized protein